jgi:hypothetical protein
MPRTMNPAAAGDDVAEATARAATLGGVARRRPW